MISPGVQDIIKSANANGGTWQSTQEEIAGVLRHDFQPFFVKDIQFKFN